jgi:hypothetical protein
MFIHVFVAGLEVARQNSMYLRHVIRGNQHSIGTAKTRVVADDRGARIADYWATHLGVKYECGVGEGWVRGVGLLL